MLFKKENENKQLNYGILEIKKENVIATSKTSVLFKLKGNDNIPIKFWISKNSIFSDNYSLFLRVSIVKEWEYKFYHENNSDWTKPDAIAKGNDVLNHLSTFVVEKQK